MRNISSTTREKRISEKIKKIKFINDEKYHKTNYISVAHFESDANNGRAGNCNICNAGYYGYVLLNKRYKTIKGGGNLFYNDILKMCYECYIEFRRQYKSELTEKYCP